MVSNILHVSYVIDFLDKEFSSDEISRDLELETNKILSSINIPELVDWQIQFRASYGKKMPIRIYKKMPSYKNEKQKLIIINIPIPTEDIVQWGVKSGQHITVGTHPNEDRNLVFLDVDFSKFNNRKDYIMDSMRRAILSCLQDGFTVNGIKVKVPKLK